MISVIENPGLLLSSVVSTNRLDGQILKKLISGQILAVRIAGYCLPSVTAVLAERLLNHPEFGFYRNAAQIGRVPQAFFESNGNRILREAYFDEALLRILDLRETFKPYLSPIDRLRLELDEAWPFGGNLLRLERGPMFVGLARVFGEGSEAYPHDDILLRDIPESLVASQITLQFGANIYLSLPSMGGELDIWNFVLTPEEYDRRRLIGEDGQRSYGLDRALIGPPATTIRPAIGELVLFCANRVHAVRPSYGGNRVTLSCFVGYSNDSSPLVSWS